MNDIHETYSGERMTNGFTESHCSKCFGQPIDDADAVLQRFPDETQVRRCRLQDTLSTGEFDQARIIAVEIADRAQAAGALVPGCKALKNEARLRRYVIRIGGQVLNSTS